MSINIVYKDTNGTVYIASDSRCSPSSYEYQTYGVDIDAKKHWRLPAPYDNTYIVHSGDVNGKNVIETLDWSSIFPFDDYNVRYEKIIKNFVPALIDAWNKRHLIRYDNNNCIQETSSGIIIVSHKNIFEIKCNTLEVSRIPTLVANGSARRAALSVFKTLLKFNPEMSTEDKLRNTIQIVAENDPTIDSNVIITKIE